MPSDLVINVRASTYDDGDILVVHNRRRIRHVHAELICFEKMAGGRLKDMDGNGIMPPGHVSEDYMRTVHQYRLERLSANEARIVRQSDNAELRLESNVPYAWFDGRMVAMDIAEHVKHLRQSHQYPVFGTYGNESYYFSEQEIVDNPKLDTIWGYIHAKTPHRETDPERTVYPLGSQDVRSFLTIPIVDIDETEIEPLVSPRYHPVTGEMLKKRGRRMANWRGLLAQLGVTQADVLNPNFPIDKRSDVPPFAHGPLVINKP